MAFIAHHCFLCVYGVPNTIVSADNKRFHIISLVISLACSTYICNRLCIAIKACHTHRGTTYRRSYNTGGLLCVMPGTCTEAQHKNTGAYHREWLKKNPFPFWPFPSLPCALQPRICLIDHISLYKGLSVHLHRTLPVCR